MIARLLAVAACLCLAAFGAEHGEGHEAGHGDPFLPYKFLNFAVLAGGLGYIFVKFGVPALRGQQRAIADDLSASALRAEEAAREAQAIEARIGNLDVELASLRDKARTELDAEAARLAAETEAQATKIQQAAAMEIEAAAKAARMELKRYAADLALSLAAEKLRARLDAPAQARLADQYIRRLESRN